MFKIFKDQWVESADGLTCVRTDEIYSLECFEYQDDDERTGIWGISCYAYDNKIYLANFEDKMNERDARKWYEELKGLVKR